MLKLKFQYFGHLMQRTDSLEKTLMLGKTEGRREGDDRGWDGWMASLTRRIWVWASSRVGDGQGRLAHCSPWVTRNWTWLRDWTELTYGGPSALPKDHEFKYYFQLKTFLSRNIQWIIIVPAACFMSGGQKSLGLGFLRQVKPNAYSWP